MAGRPHPDVPPLGVGDGAPVVDGVAMGTDDGEGVMPTDEYVIYIEYWLASTGRLSAPYGVGHVPYLIGYLHADWAAFDVTGTCVLLPSTLKANQ
jgi:hypothetical protein